MSNICLGAMTFGTTDKAFPEFFKSDRVCSERLSNQLMDKYAEMGGNFIDTADMYAFGNSEEIIGTWLKKQKREKMIIATKARFQTEFDNPNWIGLSRRHLVEACEASLRRLQTDYIDLYQAHGWDNAVPIEETLRTYDDLVRCGKIRYYGFSNVCGWQLQKIADTAKELGLNKCISLQQQYNMLERDSEVEAFMVCRNEGMGVLPWSPLKSGLLTGKFKRDTDPDAKGSRMGLFHKIGNLGTGMPLWGDYKDNDAYWNLLEAMKVIAEKHEKTLAQVAIRWLLQKEIVSSVIIGVTSMSQLEDNMGAATGWTLTDEEMKQLDDLSRPKNSYPYSEIWGGLFARGRYNRFNNESFDI